MARITDASQLTPIELTAKLLANKLGDGLDYYITVQQIIESLSISGAGVPSSTPFIVGQTYIDTTAKRKYVATGTSTAADWDIVGVYKSGTVTVTAGGGDVTVNLPWDWTGGKLSIVISQATTDWMDATVSRTAGFETSYDALTGSYTAGHVMRLNSEPGTGNLNIMDNLKSTNASGNPKSATPTSFTLDDDGAATVYVKWFCWA